MGPRCTYRCRSCQSRGGARPGLRELILQIRQPGFVDPGEFRVRACEHRAEGVVERVRCGPEAEDVAGGVARAEDVLAPVIGRRFAIEAGVVDRFAAIKRQGGLEGVFGGRTLGEAVDCDDGGFVHARGGIGQAAGQRHAILVAAFQHRECERVFRIVRRGVLGGVGNARGIREARANTFAQLLGGGAGEGHHQDVADAGVLLDDQPQVQAGEAEGLAGARAGFDQAQAGKRQRFGFERLDLVHAVASVTVSAGSTTRFIGPLMRVMAAMNGLSVSLSPSGASSGPSSSRK